MFIIFNCLIHNLQFTILQYTHLSNHFHFHVSFRNREKTNNDF